VAALCLYVAFSFVAVTNEPLELGMQHLVWRHHYHNHKFYIKYYLQVNNYKHGDGAKLELVSDKFNLDRL